MQGIAANVTNMKMPRFQDPFISFELRAIALKIEMPAQPIRHKVMQQMNVNRIITCFEYRR